ncbi:MAG: SufS family cysteine desulfurase [Alphaproteobacteria bacterium]|nr:SufS family cysteine desulfurase [Alphaproteobacteria bacterium]MDP6515238.1 SufS family cysteine desulfurase [Alphaproteobacteria bacterium]
MVGFDAGAVRAQFPILATQVHGRALHYLDNAATSQMPRQVLDAVVAHETTRRANVLRGVHALAEAATEAYEDARVALAGYINAPDAAEVVFTGGTTAAINLVARSYGALLEPGDEVVISAIEHHSNLVPWQMLRDRAGIVLKALPVTGEGRIDLDALESVVTGRTRLIALAHVSNVTGAVSDTARVVAAARAVGAKVLFDGAQAVPHGAVDVQALGCDFYAFSGHKMFGPNGIGVLWARAELLDAMPPFLGGGEMIRSVTLEHTSYARAPHRFEAGTPPIAQAVGLGAAVNWTLALDGEGAATHLRRLTALLLDGVRDIPGLRILGPEGLQARAPVISFDIAGLHPHDICTILDAHGVALRGGHHCAQPLMECFDLAGTTRASLQVYNDEGDVEALLSGLDDARARLA